MTKPPVLRPALLLLGNTVRELRTGQEIGLRALSRQTGIPPSEISDWERGMRRPRAENLALVLGALQVQPAAYRYLMQLLGQSDRLSYVEELTPETTSLHRIYEKLAVRTYEWASHLLPDALRSAEYVKMVSLHHDARPDDVDQEVFARLLRQLDRPPDHRHIALVSDAALPSKITFPSVDRVTMRVVPTSACPSGMLEPFTIHETTCGARTVVLQHEHARTFLAEPRTVERYRSTFKKLQQKSVDYGQVASC